MSELIQTSQQQLLVTLANGVKEYQEIIANCKNELSKDNNTPEAIGNFTKLNDDTMLKLNSTLNQIKEIQDAIAAENNINAPDVWDTILSVLPGVENVIEHLPLPDVIKEPVLTVIKDAVIALNFLKTIF